MIGAWIAKLTVTPNWLRRILEIKRIFSYISATTVTILRFYLQSRVAGYWGWLTESSCQVLSKLKKMDDNENQFVVDDVSKIIKDTIEGVISGNAYQQEKVNQWSASVSEQCLSALSKLKKSFKYVVTCSIMQKTGAALHTASSCYWDSGTDGTCTVRWENKTMYCIVSVFGLAI